MSSYKDNPFHEGQKVICISNHFPIIRKYSTDKNLSETSNKPQKGDIFIIDEILGEFLRFDCKDDEDSCNWWYHGKFMPVISELKGKRKVEAINEKQS